MTWAGKGRAALINTNAYTAIITDYGQLIWLDVEVAKNVFSLDPEEYCWEDWEEHDITGDYDSYEDALEDFDEIIAEWSGTVITIHDLEKWNERRVFFLGDEYGDWITSAEAVERWGLGASTIRNAIMDGRFRPDEHRKSGKVWLVTTTGMERLYGKENEKRS